MSAGTSPAFSYGAFGLNLIADRPIPGLHAAAAGAPPSSRLRIWFDAHPPVHLNDASADPWYVSPYFDESGTPILAAWRLGGGSHLRFRYSDGAEFVFDRNGAEIWVTCPAPLTFADATSYLLGPMIGVALRLRGSVCLHASAVAFDSGIVAMMGHEGAGKSTTAAAFAEQGFAVVSDDLVPLTETDAAWLAHPAYPRLRLWPSSVDAIANISPAFPRLPDDWGDRRYHVDFERHGYRFQQSAMPLSAVYLIGPRTEDSRAPFIEDLPPREKLMALVANTFAARVLDVDMRRREFDQLGRLAARVPLRRVRPHVDATRLPQLCRAIASDVRQLALIG